MATTTPLPAARPSALIHDGGAQLVDVGVGSSRIGKGFVGCGRDAVALHEGLGEGLGAFQLGSRPGGTKDLQAVGAEFIDHAGCQRCLRANHGQPDLFLLRPFAQGHHVGDGQVFQLAASQGRAAIAWGNKHLRRLGRLRQFPRQGVFAATAADDKYLHSSAL
jgi:hypothetical protein